VRADEGKSGSWPVALDVGGLLFVLYYVASWTIAIDDYNGMQEQGYGALSLGRACTHARGLFMRLAR
jgi:hypothetical protein